MDEEDEDDDNFSSFRYLCIEISRENSENKVNLMMMMSDE